MVVAAELIALAVHASNQNVLEGVRVHGADRQAGAQAVRL